MLRGWVFDGGKPAKFFKQSSVEFSCTRSSGLQASWLSYKETCDKIGEEELKARVAAGTIQHRKNPEDRRFFQFKLHKAWCCAKFITADSGESCRFTLSGNRRHHHLPQNWLQGPGQSGRHPPGHRFLRQPSVEDFDLGEASEVDDEESQLKAFVGLPGSSGHNKKEAKPKPKAKLSKWEEASQISKETTTEQLQQKAIRFMVDFFLV